MSKKVEKDQIVPFGKYKGQPLNRLLNDESYARWLSGQSWFRDKFQSMNTLIINNYHTQEFETPEHNEMQIKFLDQEHVVKLAYLVSGGNLFMHDNSYLNNFFAELLRGLSNDNGALQSVVEKLTSLNNSDLLEISQIDFETQGADVTCMVSYGCTEVAVLDDGCYIPSEIYQTIWNKASQKIYLRVELKPEIGDDFPAVLRQMKASKSNTLVIKRYNGTGATFDQFRDFFTSQKIRVFKEEEIDLVSLPTYDREFLLPENFLLQLEG